MGPNLFDLPDVFSGLFQFLHFIDSNILLDGCGYLGGQNLERPLLEKHPLAPGHPPIDFFSCLPDRFNNGGGTLGQLFQNSQILDGYHFLLGGKYNWPLESKGIFFVATLV